MSLKHSTSLLKFNCNYILTFFFPYYYIHYDTVSFLYYPNVFPPHAVKKCVTAEKFMISEGQHDNAAFQHQTQQSVAKGER